MATRKTSQKAQNSTTQQEKEQVQGNNLQEKQNTALAAAAEDMEAEAGAGFEQADSESYAIPFLRVLQDLSPQVKKQRSEYIPGASAGMILNTVTEDLYPADEQSDEPGVVVIPAYYRRAFVEWIPRSEGGGFVTEHPVGVEKGLQRDGGKFITSDGNELADTRFHYVILISEDGGYEPALITMTSTQIQASKRWMSMMSRLKMKNSAGKTFTPPAFSHKYRLQTKPQSNDQGDWYGWTISNVGQLQAEDMEYYEAAKSFRDAVKAGTVKEQAPESDIPGESSEF